MDGHKVVSVNGIFCFFYLSFQQSIPVYTEERGRGERRGRKEERRKKKDKKRGGRLGKHPKLHYLAKRKKVWILFFLFSSVDAVYSKVSMGTA